MSDELKALGVLSHLLKVNMMWKEAPLKDEVESAIAGFFSLLKENKTAQAKRAISHRFDDWDSQLWSLWQDTHLLYLEEEGLEVEDERFEGQGWISAPEWLSHLSLGAFEWDPTDQLRAQDQAHLVVPILYRGEIYDVAGHFVVEKRQEGYVVTRIALKAG